MSTAEVKTRFSSFDGPLRDPRAVDRVVVHESVTRSEAATLRALKRRGLGVHFIVDEHGRIRQHAEVTARLSHAGRLNGRSVGVEIVTPYYPALARTPWTKCIEARWAHGGAYVLPTREQLEALVELLVKLEQGAYGVCVPRRFVGMREGRLRMGRVKGASGPGIYAHHYTAHADGAFPVLYAWLRLQAGLDEAEALAQAVNRGQRSGRWAELPAAGGVNEG